MLKYINFDFIIPEVDALNNLFESVVLECDKSLLENNNTFAHGLEHIEEFFRNFFTY